MIRGHILNSDSSDNSEAIELISEVFYGLSKQRPDFGDGPYVADSKVYVDVEAIGGGDITYFSSEGNRILNCTTGDGIDGKARVELPQGETDRAEYSEVYARYNEQAGAVQLLVADRIPSVPCLKLAYASIQDHAGVTSHGAQGFQRLSQVADISDVGLFDRMLLKTRKGRGGAQHEVGIGPDLIITPNGSGLDSVIVNFTGGALFQANLQSVPALNMADGFFLKNITGGTLDNYDVITDLNQITTDGSGDALTDGDSVILDFMVLGNYSEDLCKVHIYPHVHKFTSDANCINAARGWRNFAIPKQYAGVGVWRCRVALKYNTASSGTWTNLLTDKQLVWRQEDVEPEVETVNYPSNYQNNHDYIYYNGSGTAHRDIDIAAPAGTLAMLLYYEDFNMESGYDNNLIKTTGGTLLSTFTDNRGAFWSPVYHTSTIRAYVETDGSVTRKGFRIKRIQYQILEETGDVEFIDITE